MLSFPGWLANVATWRRPLTACGVSAVVNAAVLLGLGMMVAHGGRQPSPPLSLMADFRAPADEAGGPLLLAEPASTPAESLPLPPAAPSAGVVHGSLVKAHGPGVAMAVALKDLGNKPATVSLSTVRDSPRSAPNPSGGRSATFFGAKAVGEKFVFVLDISGSMSEGGKFRRAKYELRKSLDALDPVQKFDIIFFNGDAIPLPGPGLIDATPKNIHDAMRWVNTIQPDGDTYPLSSLQMGLRLDPDAIFLLSDGQFDPETVFIISQMNGTSRPVPIHTIALVSRIGEPVMRALSKVTGGTFRFVH